VESHEPDSGGTQNPKTYLYLDIVYPWQSVQVYDDLKALKFTHIFVFLECWRTHLANIHNVKKVYIVYGDNSVPLWELWWYHR
jgi:hypothetical protein